MSLETALPNKFLERVVVAVAEREIAARDGRAGAAWRVSILATFATLMGVKTKQAVSYWIGTGGVPRKHAQRLREVVEKAGLSLTQADFEKLMLPLPEPARRGENKALQRAVEAVRSRGVPLVELASRMGMSYWQLHRCQTTLGGLPPERLTDLVDTLRELEVPLPAESLVDCIRLPTDATRTHVARPRKSVRELRPVKWWLPADKALSRDKASSRGR